VRFRELRPVPSHDIRYRWFLRRQSRIHLQCVRKLSSPRQACSLNGRNCSHPCGGRKQWRVGADAICRGLAACPGRSGPTATSDTEFDRQRHSGHEGIGEGARELQISIDAVPSEGGVRVGVRDTGPGLSPESLSRLFEPFYTTKPEGMAWVSRSAARSSKPTADGYGRSRANRKVLSFSLRSPLTEPPSVIDVAYLHFRIPRFVECPIKRCNLATPVPSNTRSRHTSAPPPRRSSRRLAAELAGRRNAECLRVDRECRRRCDPEPA
jgi:hypothetical protein